MVASYGYTQPKNRVPGSSKVNGGQTGSSNNNPCYLAYDLNEVGGQEHERMEGEQEYATAEDEDGVGPDDAPEIFCDEEV